MKAPFFSVIIPTLNRAELLREAIQSVLNQTFENYELIVVDDYSTDNTKELVESFKDIRVNYVKNNHNKGVAGARNAGIYIAKGEWVAFLDSDDVWIPEKLQMTYKKIQEIDDVTGLVYTGFAYYDFENKKEISFVIPEKSGWIQKDLLYTNCIGTFSVVSIRTDILRKVGGCDERYYYFEDNDLYVRIAGLTKVAFIKEILTYSRQSNADRLFFQIEKRLDGYQLFLEKYKKIINKNPRLLHRISSIIFICSIRQKNWSITLKYIPWTLAGLFFDIHNFLKTFRAALLILSDSKKKKKLNQN